MLNMVSIYMFRNIETQQYKFKMNNSSSHRHIDENGYLFVDESPILRSGILEYYGSELGQDEIDGIKIEPDTLYRVKIEDKELKKSADTFSLLPLVNDHTWLGKEGEDSRNYQEGTTGEKIVFKDGMLYAPLKWTSIDTVEQILNGEKEELSSSYENRLIRSNSGDCDFIAVDLHGNHVALVDKGRCGDKVRVLNEEKKMANENEKVIVDGVEIDVEKLAADALEKANDKAEEAKAEVEIENEEVDKRKLIDEVGGFLKDKGLSDEDIRFVMGKMEKASYEDSTASADNESLEAKSENEDAEEEHKAEDEEAKAENECGVKSENSAKVQTMNYEAVFAKAFNAFARQMEQVESAKVKAYNAAREVLGDFNPFGLSEKEMYVKALNHLNIVTEGKESCAELAAMLKAGANVRSRVDNGFSYKKETVKDEMKLNF